MDKYKIVVQKNKRKKIYIAFKEDIELERDANDEAKDTITVILQDKVNPQLVAKIELKKLDIVSIEPQKKKELKARRPVDPITGW